MIKQIQLRGISRTPSDRMSEDGGLSESLNMYMDTAENAPALVPKDSTKDLGLPEDLQAERIFIHKTANYENYIVVQNDRVVAYTPKVEDEEPLTVLDLADGEEVNDIASVGNTLIITTSKDLYYVLHKDRAYTLLGNVIPFPNITFTPKYGEVVGVFSGGFLPYLDDHGFGQKIDAAKLEEGWNEDKNTKGEHNNKDIQSQLALFWSKYDSVTAIVAERNDTFISPLFVRYAVELYDKTLISSMPILVNPKGVSVVATADYRVGQREGQYGELEGYEEGSFNAHVSSFKVDAKLQDGEDLESWKDIYSAINIYITRPYKDFINRNASTISNIQEKEEGYDYIVNASILMTNLAEDALLDESANSYKVKNIPLFDDKGNITKDYEELEEGFEFGPSIVPESGYEEQDLLILDDMKHYASTSKKIDVYNNQLLLLQPSQLIDYHYSGLNAYDKVDITAGQTAETTFDVTYILKSYTKDKVIKKQFTYSQSETTKESIYAFQIFPDSRAYKMIVKATIISNGSTMVKYGEFEMHPHPYLDCAYYYGGGENELIDLCDLSSVKDHDINYVDDLENKLFVSEQDNPFTFPLEHRYTFQSKVIGVAVASTALSQGQFGQYPLYVFTEDGIWAMETAADGSFVSQKPLSREVCVNPASITAIDNAVVFVTDKAVMIIQGAEAVNISPYMNGKHYIPNDSARSIIAKQEGFSIFDSAISDNTPFMAFMKKASIAYDFTGQRLICFASDETFQYIYKLDTQTWHKTMFSEINLDAPLNSYPECLVLGGRNKEHQHIYNLSTVLDTTEIQQAAKGILITRPFDLGMPDVYKSITNIKIRGDYAKGSVRYVLQGSDNGRDFFTLTSLRGKSWKMFRIFILADLEPTERISWIDIDFEPRYNNRLR